MARVDDPAVGRRRAVRAGTDQEAREILESEQRGVELQRRFCEVSRFVPKVFDSGFTDDYFYIAMEYIAGEDLSQAIHRGPLPWQRAVAIAMQLCEFLEEAHRFELSAPPTATQDEVPRSNETAAPTARPAGAERGEGVPASERREGVRRDEVPRSSSVLLHNDLKPRNIRLMAGDEIKVLDFGAAKALSLSRKVTKNDFGSTAYLSPECLESGDRDLHSDAWALGVLLYEMVRGRQPFRADDTRLLEHRIRSRTPPESIAGYCPPALEAVIAKLLAPYAADRYASPLEIREDLARVQTGQTSHALAEGWPSRHTDEPATKRTHPPIDDAATRRTNTGPEPGAGAEVGAPPPPPGVAQVQIPVATKSRRLTLAVSLAGASPGCVWSSVRGVSLMNPPG